MNDKLDQIFNVEPTEVTDVTNKGDIIDAKLTVETDEKIESDYDNTRTNLHNLLHQGQDALNHALEVAKMSEHPRAFEVVGNLMKQLSDINHQLLDLHSKKAKLEQKDTKENVSAPNVTNNTMFVGSTTELSKMIEQMRKGK